MDITVVIPARNASHYLPSTLASIAAQNLSPAEIIVIDDGSTDETGRLAADLGARVLRGEGRGAAAALNQGIEAATTELIAHFDADDLMRSDKLSKQHACFANDSSDRLGLVSSDLRMFDERGDDDETFLQRGARLLPDALARVVWTTDHRPLASDLIRFSPDESARLLSRAHLIDVKGVYRKSVWEAVGGFDPAYRCAYDMDFVWRVSRHFDIGLIPTVLFSGRRHRDNLSGNPTLVAQECARLFLRMTREIATTSDKSVLRERRRRELMEIAYLHRKQHHWAKSARYYLEAVVA